MIRSLFRLPLMMMITVFVCIPVYGQTKLKVGVAGSPPFVINNQGKFEGISVEIWQEIAQTEGLKYELIPQSGINAGLNAVSQGEIDILVGPISIKAERLKKVRFTYPYFLAEVGLLIPNQQPTLWNRLQPFLHLAVLSSLGILFLIIFIVGNLLWLAERKRNPEHFPKSYWSGVESGMWFALVTLTTVGYGDKAPVTKAGRLITCIWMLVSLVTASSLTAVLTTAFTLSLAEQSTDPYPHPNSIRNARIAVVSGTTGADWAKLYQAKLIQTSSLDAAIKTLLSRKAQGVIFDTPALEYYLHQHSHLPLTIASVTFAEEYYGFAITPDTISLVQTLNLRLVEMNEIGAIRAIENKWLDKVPNSKSEEL